jgi:hypothetical protein
VKLLHAIYSSPTQLLDKSESDGVALLKAVNLQDKEQARAALFNFAVTTYHVWDWVRAHRPDLDRPATNPLKLHVSIAACRDLANASKHSILTVTKGAYKKHPPIVQSVVVSAIPPGAGGPSGSHVHASPWRFKIQLATGRRFPVEDLVREALTAWKGYFGQHSIK